jgi:hypothetical protein
MRYIDKLTAGAMLAKGKKKTVRVKNVPNIVVR